MNDTTRLLRDTHTDQAIRRRLDAGPSHSYLRDWIYGAIDGAVTTFAVVCGVAGAGLPDRVIIILGMANLAADGFSMAASNYLGTRAEHQQCDATRQAEEIEVRTIPDREREEIRQIFARKGFEGEHLEHAVAVITSDPRRWVETMLVEEHGITGRAAAPWRAAVVTFIAFVVVGALPLLPYLATAALGTSTDHAFTWSVIMTGIAFFGVGALKTRFVPQSWLRAGLEVLTVGGLAAALAFAAGALLKGVAG
ncbi:MAG: VIT1/CCC1 transporter family protein [Phycisphaerales bacterium]